MPIKKTQLYDVMLNKLKDDREFRQDYKQRKLNEFDTNRNKGDNWFFERLVDSIFAGGFSRDVCGKKKEEIRELLENFDISSISAWSDPKIVEYMKSGKGIANAGKKWALYMNAVNMNKLSQEYGSFGDYINQFKSDQKKLRNELRKQFRYLGKDTVHDYIKDIGIDDLKPDIWVRRTMEKMSFVRSQNDRKEVFQVANQIKAETGEKLSQIDLVFLQFGSKYCKNCQFVDHYPCDKCINLQP